MDTRDEIINSVSKNYFENSVNQRFYEHQHA